MTKKIAECVKCGEQYSYRRRELGYYTCLECGRHEALKEIVRRSTCVAPAFNKGAYIYIHSQQDAKDAGK
jgi:anaerobic ribonucleoside-triphosphate reductase